jgi:hypothetical protein
MMVNLGSLARGELAWTNANISPKTEIIFFFSHHLDDLEYGKSEFQSYLNDLHLYIVTGIPMSLVLATKKGGC